MQPTSSGQINQNLDATAVAMLAVEKKAPHIIGFGRTSRKIDQDAYLHVRVDYIDSDSGLAQCFELNSVS